jgi:hypothetical protein
LQCPRVLRDHVDRSAPEVLAPILGSGLLVTANLDVEAAHQRHALHGDEIRQTIDVAIQKAELRH